MELTPFLDKEREDFTRLSRDTLGPCEQVFFPFAGDNYDFSLENALNWLKAHDERVIASLREQILSAKGHMAHEKVTGVVDPSLELARRALRNDILSTLPTTQEDNK